MTRPSADNRFRTFSSRASSIMQCSEVSPSLSSRLAAETSALSMSVSFLGTACWTSARAPSFKTPVSRFASSFSITPPAGFGVFSSTLARASAAEFATATCPQTLFRNTGLDVKSKSPRTGGRCSLSRSWSHPLPTIHFFESVLEARLLTALLIAPIDLESPRSKFLEVIPYPRRWM